MKITFYGGAGTVTGSCYLLDTGASRIMVDCGLFQGSRAIKERNYGPFLFQPSRVDVLLLTHAHIDHTGMVPKLYKQGFRGPIYATGATADLLSALLPDSAHIQEMEVERKNRKNSRSGKTLLQPIYTVEDAQECLNLFHGLEYGQDTEVAPGVRARFLDAGHILGSAMIELFVKEEDRELKIVFSGDIGNYGQPIINDPTRITSADYLIMESTYGNRLHQEKVDKLDALSEVIKETFARGGNLVIPAFAVERTQDLLYDLNLLISRGEISPENIYLDSPLAVTATEIFCRNPQYYDEETQALRLAKGGQCPLYLPGLKFCRTMEESMAINKIKSGALIIAASGMCDAGRIKHHLKHNLWRPECTVLFVGYQAEGTLGRRLKDGEKRVHIHGEEVVVRAQIRSLEGFSAHADQHDLLKWLQGFQQKPRTVLIVHGEEEASLELSRLVSGEEFGAPTLIPAYLQEISLKPGERAEVVAAVPQAVSAGMVEDVHRRVLGKLDRLLEGKDRERVLLELMELEKRLEQRETMSPPAAPEQRSAP